jgi:hypothetical protein
MLIPNALCISFLESNSWFIFDFLFTLLRIFLILVPNTVVYTKKFSSSLIHYSFKYKNSFYQKEKNSRSFYQ